MVNVAIQAGWAEGPRFTRDLAAALVGAGFNITGPKHADVLIAHSSACYQLPLKTPITFFMLVDPPYWPNKSLLARVVEKKRQDSRLIASKHGKKAVAKKTLWELAYVIGQPSISSAAFNRHDSLDFLGGLSEKHVLLVRNTEDEFCSSEIQVALAVYPFVQYKELPGHHDDIYANPLPYVHLLRQSLQLINEQSKKEAIYG